LGLPEGVGQVLGLVQQVLGLLVDAALLAGGGDHRSQVASAASTPDADGAGVTVDPRMVGLT
jgi:hypothetical protein